MWKQELGIALVCFNWRLIVELPFYSGIVTHTIKHLTTYKPNTWPWKTLSKGVTQLSWTSGQFWWKTTSQLVLAPNYSLFPKLPLHSDSYRWKLEDVSRLLNVLLAQSNETGIRSLEQRLQIYLNKWRKLYYQL